MMLPASCKVPSNKISRPPTAPISGALRIVDSAESSVPGSNCASLFNKSRYSPRAWRAPWFTAARKCRFSVLRMIRAPSSRSSSNGVRSEEALSIMMTSSRSAEFSTMDRRHASVSSALLNNTIRMEMSGLGLYGIRIFVSEAKRL